MEFMAFPRIAAIAEIARSPAPDSASRDHEAFFARVAGFGAHLDALGVTYYPVRGVPWVK
jgi:hexosaminidase